MHQPNKHPHNTSLIHRPATEKAEAEAEKKDGHAIELLRRAFGQNVVFFEFLEPGSGPKDPQVITIVIDMGMTGRL